MKVSLFLCLAIQNFGNSSIDEYDKGDVRNG